MAVTSFYREYGNRWLTSVWGGAAGSEHTLTIGHPMRQGEFTTLRLSEPVGANDRGELLFDLDEAFTEFDGEWLPLKTVREIVADHNAMEARGFLRSAFGSWKKDKVA